MRIGMMVDSYKPYISGITNFVETNKRYLELVGHDVFVFTFGNLDYKDDEPRVIRSRGVPLSDSGRHGDEHRLGALGGRRGDRVHPERDRCASQTCT